MTNSKITSFVNLFVKPCYYALENDNKYKNLHFIKRKLFLNKFRHDSDYISKVEKYTGRDKEDLYKEARECILFIRQVIYEELDKIIKIEKNNIPEDIEERLYKLLNQKLNEKYENIIF